MFYCPGLFTSPQPSGTSRRVTFESRSTSQRRPRSRDSIANRPDGSNSLLRMHGGTYALLPVTTYSSAPHPAAEMYSWALYPSKKPELACIFVVSQWLWHGHVCTAIEDCTSTWGLMPVSLSLLLSHRCGAVLHGS